MKVILVGDIFGKTQALDKLRNEIGAEDIFDPYNGELHEFPDEKSAYQYFIEHVGMAAYTNKLSTYLTAETEKLVLIGFSVGASAIWQLSNSKTQTNIEKAICFYGSQIRHFTDVTPHFPIQLIFPSYEQHFSVKDLINKISGRNLVNVDHIATEYRHGFMNELSEGFSETGYQKYLLALSKQIKNES